MSKLWILIVSAMVFIPAFSYAEEKQEEKCDQAIINNGVELYEAYAKALESLPEKASKKVREAYDIRRAEEDGEFLPEYKAYEKAIETYGKVSIDYYQAHVPLSIIDAYNAREEVREKAMLVDFPELKVYFEARELLPEYEAYERSMRENHILSNAYRRALESLPESDALQKAATVASKARKAYRTACDFQMRMVDPDLIPDDIKDPCKFLPEYVVYKEAITVQASARKAFQSVSDSLPEVKAFKQFAGGSFPKILESYERASRSNLPKEREYMTNAGVYRMVSEGYHKAHETLPQWQALRSFTEVNEACKEEINRAYEERKQRLSSNRSSRPNQSGSSSNSKKSQERSSGSSSGKAVQ